ncbi:hypothetical protein ACFPFP_38575 [Bradyrhizobium sp. GCM10023182]|uniref:Uncharacterized protein n=1 Tax=Bradyrhizobium zhengyangense TaxID=2911009 RepID=A0ABS9M0N5_9BRAD|nr:hypothetical protein [Bradyrhizobium zhengyangense]MCG2672819.1 hypothetical protein [Bradyrhizobium zhengyangense]
MKATIFTGAAVAIMAMLSPSIVEAGDGARLYRKPHWHSAYGYYARLARIAPPVVTLVTPDLSYPVPSYVYSRLDDSYDYPFGYGEYAIYGRWARDSYGSPDVTRCRLIWFDGPRLRSLNRCN